MNEERNKQKETRSEVRKYKRKWTKEKGENVEDKKNEKVKENKNKIGWHLLTEFLYLLRE